MLRRRFLVLTLLTVLALGGAGEAWAQNEGEEEAPPRITLLVTETLEAVGLTAHLIPIFEESSGIQVEVVARNAAEAVRLARAGQGDVLLLDDYALEQELVQSELVTERRDVMYIELLIVGPQADPAGIAGMVSVIDALQYLARAEAPFISRGDMSGTHRAELSFWDEAGQIPTPSANAWYTVTEADMRTTLGLAAARNAYTLTDRATWLRLRNRRQLRIVVADDPRMLLRFGVSVINPQQVESVQEREARAFMIWLTSEPGQEAIAAFQIDEEPVYSIHMGLSEE